MPWNKKKRSPTTPRNGPTAVGITDTASPPSVGSDSVVVTSWSPGEGRIAGPIAVVGGRRSQKRQKQKQQNQQKHGCSRNGCLRWFALMFAVLTTVSAFLFLNWRYYENHQHALDQAVEGQWPRSSDGTNDAPSKKIREGQAEKPAAVSEEMVIDNSSGRRTSSPRCKGRFVNGLEDILHCYPQEGRTIQLTPDCRSITTWEDVKRCLNGFRTTTDAAKENEQDLDEEDDDEEEEDEDVGVVEYEIHVIGERNSGTKFITKEMQQCFDGGGIEYADAGGGSGGRRFVAVKAHRDFYRGKHWFQPVGEYAQYADATRYKRRIVVAVFRDPADWLAAMRENPYHSPHHVASYDAENVRPFPLPWMDFLAKPWTMHSPNGTAATAPPANPQRATATTTATHNITSVGLRLRRRLRKVGGGAIVEKKDDEEFGGGRCSHRYHEEEVVPCRFGTAENRLLRIPDPLIRGYAPIYEMRRDGSGLPYDSVVDLRSDKIVNFALEVPVLVPHLHGYLAVRYEDLLTEGTGPFLSEVAEMVGIDLPLTCPISPPQPHRIGHRYIPDDVRQWIYQRLNNDTERLLGYVP